MKVFISYASQDTLLARRISETLRASGLDVWDDTEILPGENWAAQVAKALQESQAMVVLLTPASLVSTHVKHEISYALGNKDYNRRLIPVVVGSPEELPKKKIPWILNQLSMVYLKMDGQDEESLKRIAQVIKEAA